MVSATAPSSPLLDKLPPELRNEIYALVPQSNTPIYVNPDSIKRSSALLRTCTQIRGEASQIFYASNIFHLASTLKKDIFAVQRVTAIGRILATSIRAIYIEFDFLKAAKKIIQEAREAHDGWLSRVEIERLSRKFLEPAENTAKAIMGAGVRPGRIDCWNEVSGSEGRDSDVEDLIWEVEAGVMSVVFFERLRAGSS